MFYIKYVSLNLITELQNIITYNDTQIYLGFLFNIYTKIKYEDETFENTTRVKRSVRKLEYI